MSLGGDMRKDIYNAITLDYTGDHLCLSAYTIGRELLLFT